MNYFRTILFAIISVCLINCSKEDDTPNIKFTEKYDGSLWELEYGLNEYNGNNLLRVINDNNANLQPFEKWHHVFLDNELCYINTRYSLDGSIIVNSNNTLQLEYTTSILYGSSVEYHRYTYKVDGTTLTLTHQRKTGNGGWPLGTTQKWYRSSEDVENLTLCYN